VILFRDKTLENNLSRRLDGDHMLAGAKLVQHQVVMRYDLRR
jgi:hypothetical protein